MPDMPITPGRRRQATVPRARVHPDPDQPRKEFPLEELAELAGSLRANGQWVRALVRPFPDRPGEFVLIDGERRWRALGMVPCDTIDLEIVDGPLEPAQLRLIQTSLGLTAKRLAVLEAGEACQRLMADLNLSPTELAAHLGTSEGTISKLLRILRDLGEAHRDDVRSAVIPFTVAYHLARLKDTAAQADLVDKFKAGLLKRDSIADEVNKLLGRAGGPAKPKPVTAGGKCVRAELTTADHDEALAEVERLARGILACKERKLPLSSLPALLRS